MRWLTTAAFIALALSGAGSKADSAELRIDFSEIAALVRGGLDGGRLRLDNTPARLRDFAPGSFVSVGGKQYPVEIPAQVFDAAGASYAYHLADINTSSIGVAAVEGALRIVLRFERDGSEIIGLCRSGLCAPSGALPAINWSDDPGLVIDVAPVRLADGVSLEVKLVEIKGEFDASCHHSTGLIAGGLCHVLLPEVRRTLARMKSNLNEAVKAQLNSSAGQREIAAALKIMLLSGFAGGISVRDIVLDPQNVIISLCLAC